MIELTQLQFGVIAVAAVSLGAAIGVIVMGLLVAASREDK